MEHPQAGDEFTVLLVDDEPSYRAAIRRCLRADAIAFVEAGGGRSALELLAQRQVHLALVDLHMPDMGGLEFLANVRAQHSQLPVVMMTAFGDMNAVVQAMKLGAADFLEKDVLMQAVRSRLVQAKRVWTLERDNQGLRRRVEAVFEFDRLVGDTPPMARLKEFICQVGPSDASVLVLGETGTGKELVAKAIHHQSPRRNKPFVVVDCAALTESLIESELFGHVKGAYTGASASDAGLFRSADGGTVFLDEIGEMPMSLQVKLLRVLQEREVRPVGSSQSERIDFRVIAATNRRLDERVHRGAFREDLYYRLAVVTLSVPPLRERLGDVPLLVNALVQRLRDEGSAVTGVDAQTLRRLSEYAWPGNIRELENLVRRALVFSRGPLLGPDDLPPDFGGEARLRAEPPELVPEVEETAISLESTERTAIVRALEQVGGSRRKAARLLGVAESTLYRKLKHFGIADVGEGGPP